MNDKNQRGSSLPQAIEKICNPIFSNFYGAPLFLNWNIVVGPKIAAVTRIESISNDTITIAVDKRSLLFVQYQTMFILERIHQHLSDDRIRRIRLKTFVNPQKNAK